MTSFPNPFSRKSSEVEELREQVRRLERSVRELSTLSEVAFAIGGSGDPDDIVKTLVDRLMRAVNAEQVVVTLTGDEQADPSKTRLRLVATSAEHSAFHLSDSLLGWMYLNKKPLIINDPHNDDAFRGVAWDPSIRAVMCVPLLVKAALTGVITVYNKKGSGGFSDDDQRLLAIIAAQSAQLIENARLNKDAAVLDQIRAQQKNAWEIQRNLLPESAPQIDGYDVAGASTPAQTVGGDCYDFIPAPGGKWAISLGDVSGKGIPAALLMANVQATLRAQTLAEIPVSERVGRSNTHICESTSDENFVTLFYSVLDAKAHSLTYCSAGHEPVLLFARNDSEPKHLESSGPALGVIDPFVYEQHSVSVNVGDVLVVYSDGVPDATNTYDDMFSLDRLVAVIAEHKQLSAAQLIEKILAAVNAHAGEAPQFDDLTLVVIKRT